MKSTVETLATPEIPQHIKSLEQRQGIIAHNALQFQICPQSFYTVTPSLFPHPANVPPKSFL